MKKLILMTALAPLLIVMAYAQDSTVEPPNNNIANSSRVAYVEGYRLAEWLKQYKAAEQKDKNTSYYHVGKAWGFIAGVVDASAEEFVIEEKLSMKQVVAIVDSYLAIHIERWHEPAADLVIDALKENIGKIEIGEIR